MGHSTDEVDILSELSSDEVMLFAMLEYFQGCIKQQYISIKFSN